MKLWNNAQWKGSSRSGFAFSELDLAANSIDSQFLYGSSVNLTPPSPAPTSFYPFTYGINVPNIASGVLQANSPYFVEKIAGVDSLGLLESLMVVIKNGSSTIASQTEGFLTGSVFTSRWQFRLSFPSFTRASSTISWPQSDYSSTPISLDAGWFNQNTRVVLNPTEVRPGDLLVGYEGSEISVAIIEGVPPVPTIASQADLWNWVKGIKVLTINHILRRAYETTWSSFSLEPMEYHVRRIVLPAGVSLIHSVGSSAKMSFIELAPVTSTLSLKLSESCNLKTSPPALKEFQYRRVSFVAQNFDHIAALANPSVKYQFTRPPEKDGTNWVNWVPNTGELHYLGKIHIQTIQVIDGTWTISAVKDYGYLPGDKNGNVYNNNPTIFDLVALATPHAEDGVSVLDTTNKVTGLNAQTSDSPGFEYIAQFQQRGDGWYTVTGPGTGTDTSYSLVVNDGYLTVKHNGIPYYDFALVAINPYPGDDIQIQFKIGDHLFTSMTQAPRLAVYDKKMLWRANLYIAEAGAGTKGSTDWNDLHPWNDPSNDWNWSPIKTGSNTPDPSKMYVDGIANWVIGNGGQVVNIASFTPLLSAQAVSEKGENVGNHCDGTVAYEYGTIGGIGPTGGEDSPFRYNWKLIEARGNLNATYSGGDPTQMVPINGFPIGSKVGRKNLQNWVATTSVHNSWSNYLRQAIAGLTAYVPNESLYQLNNSFFSPPFSNEGKLVPSTFDGIGNSIGAGTDCFGFVSRSSGYANNPYTSWNSSGRLFIEAKLDHSEPEIEDDKRHWPIPTSGYSSVIISENDYVANISPVDFQKKAQNVVPGDIFIYYDSAGNKSHIGIIGDASGLYDFTAIDKDQVLACLHNIESTYDNKNQAYFGNVVKIFTMLDYANKPGWQIVRLK